ncbi:hypothetical protein DEO72_LG11g1169 [Vigna unguiculata]|uniref:Uncharacterized protein n=1 Tax=Vigna unguiculata TaxID=3917 RepID=A0A4D6NMM5_VIGUN|nr:hypothetical protein DEO72_LG11g1169 [Vigna unguiculata]
MNKEKKLKLLKSEAKIETKEPPPMYLEIENELATRKHAETHALHFQTFNP